MLLPAHFQVPDLSSLKVPFPPPPPDSISSLSPPTNGGASSPPRSSFGSPLDSCVLYVDSDSANAYLDAHTPPRFSPLLRTDVHPAIKIAPSA
ncbi:hypothetical protein R3P38DRAFT_3218694 [Favolaschia claudopus]|uniref:Uncharacterized protein n=1 Tax=Favolaschia claudopus TaxID=2862362 RepID=A0AAW0A3H6_9AGAR